MKIAINTSCIVAGGAITHLRHLLPSLIRLADGDSFVAIGDSETLERIRLPDGIERIVVPPHRFGLAGRLWFENVSLPSILIEEGVDVLFHPGNFGVFRSPVPQVTLVHNLAPFLPDVVSDESRLQRLRLAILRSLTSRSVRSADRTIFISRWGRTRVLSEHQIDESRHPIVYFGAEHGAATSDPGILEQWGLKPGKYVLTVSHLYRYKKLENLIDAYIRAGEAIMGMPLVVVGNPYDRDYAKRMEERAKPSREKILFTGGLDARSLGSLMADCKIFVFTSEAENLPITLLEAMASGCAIVTNRACSMPEVCADAVVYAEPATPATYEKAILRLAEDDVERDRFKDAASKRASEFTWDESARRTLSVLRHVGDVGQ